MINWIIKGFMYFGWIPILIAGLMLAFEIKKFNKLIRLETYLQNTRKEK